MKTAIPKLFVLFFFAIIANPLSGQKAVNKLIDKLKEDDNAYAVTLPGWFIRSGAKMILNEEEIDFRLEQGYHDIIDGIKRLRVVVIPENMGFDSKKVAESIETVKAIDNLVDYARVKDDGNKVHVMVKEEGEETIKNLVVFVQGEEELVLMTLKTDITMTELKNANLSFNEKQ